MSRAALEADLVRRRGRYVSTAISVSAGRLSQAVGLTLHRTGGISLIGIPRAGGTTLSWRGCREHMLERGANPVADVAGVAIFAGEQF